MANRPDSSPDAALPCSSEGEPATTYEVDSALDGKRQQRRRPTAYVNVYAARARYGSRAGSPRPSIHEDSQ